MDTQDTLRVELQDLLDTLRARGFGFENGRAVTFGSFEDDLRAFEGAALVPLLATTPLRLTGTDRLNFLHGQVSNEVKRLEVGGASAALMLNVRGHALAGMRIYRRADDLFVAVEGGAGERVVESFRDHIIFDQVEIADLSDTILSLTLQGERAERVLGSLWEVPAAGRFVQVPFQGAKLLISPVRRSLEGGFDLHVLTKDVPTLLDALQSAGATFAGERALLAARVAAGIPAAETEGGDGVLPQEAGLDPWVSYRKGCYLGQEIMARIEARGAVRRELRGVRLEALPGDARDLRADEKTVGRLGAVVDHPAHGPIGLAVVRKGAPERLEVGGTTATLRELPFGARE